MPNALFQKQRATQMKALRHDNGFLDFIFSVARFTFHMSDGLSVYDNVRSARRFTGDAPSFHFIDVKRTVVPVMGRAYFAVHIRVYGFHDASQHQKASHPA